MEKVLMIDLDQCGGCRTCELICSWKHNLGVVRPSGSRIRVLRDEKLGINVPVACQHCEKPVCKDVCPVDAIGRDGKTGAVEINQDVCIGCRYCMMMCPFGAIGMDSLTRVMIKCDLCQGNPKCVQWCPREAIRYEKAEIALSAKQGRVMEEHLTKPLIEARKQLIATGTQGGD